MELPRYTVWAFKVALTVNVLSTVFNILNDCDEVYNYWEPLYFISTLGSGGGFQTWEYSPTYALRSYFYLWLLGWPAFASQLVGLPDWFGFLLVRLHLGVLSALSVACLSSALQRTQLQLGRKIFGLPLSVLFVGLFCLSPGNFLSSTTLVPSGVATCLCTFMLAFWICNRFVLAVGCVAAMGILVWPFAALLGVPLAIHMLLIGHVSLLLRSAVAWSILFTVPMFIVDSLHFGRPTLATFNIIFYNIFSPSTSVSGSASQLYGVEPASFYVKNYLLNHNVALLMACCSIVCTFLFAASTFLTSRTWKQKKRFPLLRLGLISASPFLLWNFIFFTQAHKEERFLFPCFPCLSLCAALFLFRFAQFSDVLPRKQVFRYLHRCLIILVILVFILLSVARIGALIRWYSAPIYLVRHLPLSASDMKEPLLCLGRDWHLFPSRFLLPGNGEYWKVGFLRSSFRGQLPGQFASNSSPFHVFEATRRDGSHFNSYNREEDDRFIRNETAECDFILDRDSVPGDREQLYVAQKDVWISLLNRTILEPHSCQSDPAASVVFNYPLMCWLLRSFYVPFFSEMSNFPIRMHILGHVQ